MFLARPGLPRTRRRTIAFVFARLAGVAIGALVLAASAVAVPAQVAIGNPSIGKVIFGGTPAHPGITITGSDLTYDRYYPASAPDPDPPYTPGDHPLCPLKLTGVQGHDYGTRLYLVDKSAQPLWAAGRYRPGLRELDCIGIVLESWTSGAIKFRFGSGYLQGRYPQLHNGDFVQIVWNHLTVGVHVKYGPDGVAPGS
jgi:hypothetical protein